WCRECRMLSTARRRTSQMLPGHPADRAQRGGLLGHLRLMGHSTIQVTFDTYGHLFPAPDEQEEFRRLRARLVGRLRQDPMFLQNGTVTCYIGRIAHIGADSAPASLGVTAATLREVVFSTADINSRLMTDELRSYRRIGRRFASHDAVNHGEEE